MIFGTHYSIVIKTVPALSDGRNSFRFLVTLHNAAKGARINNRIISSFGRLGALLAHIDTLIQISSHNGVESLTLVAKSRWRRTPVLMQLLLISMEVSEPSIENQNL